MARVAEGFGKKGGVGHGVLRYEKKVCQKNSADDKEVSHSEAPSYLCKIYMAFWGRWVKCLG